MATLRNPVTPHDHIRGADDAPVTLLEYGDYECPACGAAFPVVNAVLERFGPYLRFAFRHFPLSQVHPNAEPAAECAEFSGAHGRFWEMHDALYENQESLSPELLLALTRALRLPERELRHVLANETYADKIKHDFLTGVRSGVNGTPSFFINGELHMGTYGFDELVTAIGFHLPVRARL
jgi:protein-disulfide isomerase